MVVDMTVVPCCTGADTQERVFTWGLSASLLVWPLGTIFLLTLNLVYAISYKTGE